MPTLTPSPRTSFHALLAMLGALVGLCVAAQPAAADVAYRGQTCKSQAFLVIGSFSMNKPAGVASGDVMIATLRSSDFLAFTFSSPSGWAELTDVSDDDAKTYYKVAGGSEPGSYTFGSMLGVGATMVGSIVAFSGADPVPYPFGTGVVTTGSGNPVALPDATAARDGSMRYAGVTSGATTASTFTAPMTEACDTAAGGIAVANAYEPQGAGGTPARTDTRGASTNYVAQTLIINPPPPPCGSGALTLDGSPAGVTFPATTITGVDQAKASLASFVVNDQRPTHDGWNLSGTSTTFTNGSQTLPTSATTVTGAGATAGAGNCSVPTSSSTYPVTLPAASVAPPAVRLYRADSGTGAGPVNLDLALSLSLPGNVHTGTYTSTWTWTLAAGP